MANHLDSLCLSFPTVKWEKKQYLPHRLVLGLLWDNSGRAWHAASVGRVSYCCEGDCLDDSLGYFHLTILSLPTTIFQGGNKCRPVSLLKEKSGPMREAVKSWKGDFVTKTAWHFLPSPQGLHPLFLFSPYPIQIKAYLPCLSSKAHISRLTVEGHGPPSPSTLSGPCLVEPRPQLAWGKSQWAHCAPSRCKKLGAVIWVHLLVCHHLLAKMLKSHTLGQPAEENLIPSPTDLPIPAADHILQKKRGKHKEETVWTPPRGKPNLLSLLDFIS